MSLLFVGAIATKAAIEGNKRLVSEVLIDKKRKDRDCAYIKRIAQNKGIKITLVDKEDINALTDKSTHGGIISYGEGRTFQSLDDIIAHPNPFLCIIEGIEDPYNYANALRSLYAAGCNGIIVPQRNWSNADDILAQASAGASEMLSIVISDNFEETINTLKQHQIKLYCALRSDEAIKYYDADFSGGVCIAIGGEMRGLSKAITALNDQAIYLPYASNFRNSLSAAASASILGFEVLRQRNIK